MSRDIIDDLCISSNCKADDFLDDEGWYLPDTMDEDFSQTVVQLKEVEYDVSETDLIIRNLSLL